MMNAECFVCGADRGTLEEYDIDKEEHEGSEHNKWSYLLYLDHVKRAAADVAPAGHHAALIFVTTWNSPLRKPCMAVKK